MSVLARLMPGESMVLGDGTMVRASDDGVEVTWTPGLVGNLFSRRGSDGSFLLSRCPGGSLAVWDEEGLNAAAGGGMMGVGGRRE